MQYQIVCTSRVRISVGTKNSIYTSVVQFFWLSTATSRAIGWQQNLFSNKKKMNCLIDDNTKGMLSALMPFLRMYIVQSQMSTTVLALLWFYPFSYRCLTPMWTNEWRALKVQSTSNLIPLFQTSLYDAFAYAFRMAHELLASCMCVCVYAVMHERCKVTHSIPIEWIFAWWIESRKKDAEKIYIRYV